MEMRLLDLFSGIGGFSYAAEKLVGGYKTVAFCEMDEFCQKVLQKHWPEIPIYDDVRTLDATRLGRIDIVTGGYPCQPFSQAGKRQGEKDERHLWPEMLRIIKSCKARYVVAENVAGHVNMGLDQVLTDLEDQGYTTRPIIIPACAKNAPHRRDRVWIIGELMADTSSLRGQNISGNNKKFATRSAKNENVEFSNSCSSDRGSELMADTKIKSFNESDNDIKSSKQKQGKFRGESSKDIVADTKNVRWEQTEWQRWESSRRRSQDIIGSETEREETDRSDATYSESEGLAHSNEREICETKQPGMDSDEERNWSGLRSKSSRRNQLSGENVADTERKSINDTNSGWNNRFEKEKQKTRTTHGSSGGQDVSNSNSHRSETRLSGQIKGQKRNTEKSINRDNRQRGWETSNDKATKQRMGDLVNGISKGLLEHFDREPEDIPRVTSGEKDRANKLKALGNSIVPQVAAEIFIAIKFSEREKNAKL